MGFGDRCHCEAAGNVNRCPEGRGVPEQSANRRLVCKVDAADKPDLLVLPIGKALRLVFVKPRHVASRTSLKQGRHDGGSERARAACHHNIPITVIHVASLIELASLGQRLSLQRLAAHENL